MEYRFAVVLLCRWDVLQRLHDRASGFLINDRGKDWESSLLAVTRSMRSCRDHMLCWEDRGW